MSQAVPPPPPSSFRSINVDSSTSPSFWERVSTWASENKAVVYTIAGVAVVVTGAGVVYYLSDSKKPGEGDIESSEKKSKKKKKSKKGAAGKQEPLLKPSEEAVGKMVL
jgi:mitochondrial import receptor subunit TOM70